MRRYEIYTIIFCIVSALLAMICLITSCDQDVESPITTVEKMFLAPTNTNDHSGILAIDTASGQVVRVPDEALAASSVLLPVDAVVELVESNGALFAVSFAQEVDFDDFFEGTVDSAVTYLTSMPEGPDTVDAVQRADPDLPRQVSLMTDGVEIATIEEDEYHYDGLMVVSLKIIGDGDGLLDTDAVGEILTLLVGEGLPLQCVSRPLFAHGPADAASKKVEFVAQVPLGYEAWDVNIIGAYAYILVGPTGYDQFDLVIYDVSDPYEPQFKGSCHLTLIGYDLHVLGNWAYAANFEGLSITDVTYPEAPIEEEFLTFSQGGAITGVYAAEDYVYLATSEGGLLVLDVLDPSNQYWCSTSGSAYEVCVAENYAYVTTGGPSGLSVVDVLNPQNPREVGFCALPGYPRGVHIVEDHAYVANGDWLCVIDISTPSNPQMVGSCDTPGSANRVYSAWAPPLPGPNLYAYVADGWKGLRLIDVTPPNNPVEVGFYENLHGAFGVHAVGNYIYVADWMDKSLYVLRLTDIGAHPW